ncbi:sulfatase [Halostagnicola bangensis]
MKSPNVLFLVVDSLRYDAVYNWEDIEIPNIRDLANNGIEFTNCFSQGVATSPSMTAVLSGRLPLDHTGHRFIESDTPSVASEFQQQGYTTCGIHSNPNLSSSRGYDNGFDVFKEDILPINSELIVNKLPNKALYVVNKIERLLTKTPYATATRMNKHASNSINQMSSPWFMWLQYMDAHGPYIKDGNRSYRYKYKSEKLWRKAAVSNPEEISNEEHELLLEGYKQEIEYTDRKIGELLDHLKEKGEFENTIVVVTSDHGEEFGEHSEYSHGNLPFDELIHVPCIISGPDIENTINKNQIRLVDILPSILDYVGDTISTDAKDFFEGKPSISQFSQESSDLTPIVSEKEMMDGETLQFGFRNGEWKYMYDGERETGLLFDLNEDGGENNDVSSDYPDVVDEFESILSDRLERIQETSENVSVPDIDNEEAVNERLKALGYR